jgi:hypothetical protein
LIKHPALALPGQGLKNHQVGKNWILLIIPIYAKEIILGLFLVACFALKVHNVLLCDAMYQHSQQFSSRLYLVFIQLISPFINHIATNTKIASKACDTNIRLIC